jgi:pyrroline-5-carboxylate reductase
MERTSLELPKEKWLETIIWRVNALALSTNFAMVTRMNFGFLGSGNMALALARGLSRPDSGLSPRFRVAGRGGESMQRFLAGVDAEATSAGSLAETCDWVFLCVKPKDAAQALQELGEGSGVLVSVVAGWTNARLDSACGSGWRILRTMPNTGVQVGSGVVGAAPGRNFSEEDLREAAPVFQKLGTFIVLPEEQMDALTAASGSGIAFALAFLESLEAAARLEGLDPSAARSAAIGTLAGAAELCRVSGQDPSNLRRAVTSPQGTTAAGLQKLEEAQWAGAVHAAVRAAVERAKELAKA